jgi:hypothetical protein
MPRCVDPRKQHFWLQHILRWQVSRLSVCDYCDRLQLSQASFYAWKRTLQQRGLVAGTTPGSARPRHAAAPAKAPFFLPVVVSEAEPSTGHIDLVLPDGWTVRVAAGFDVGTLRQLLALLRERSC